MCKAEDRFKSHLCILSVSPPFQRLKNWRDVLNPLKGRMYECYLTSLEPMRSLKAFSQMSEVEYVRNKDVRKSLKRTIEMTSVHTPFHCIKLKRPHELPQSCSQQCGLANTYANTPGLLHLHTKHRHATHSHTWPWLDWTQSIPWQARPPFSFLNSLRRGT